MTAPASVHDEVPAHVQAWIRALLDPEFLDIVRAVGPGQIDVRLSAAGGKVRRRPTITISGGPQEMIDP